MSRGNSPEALEDRCLPSPVPSSSIFTDPCRQLSSSIPVLPTRHVFCKDGSCNRYQQPPSGCYKSSQGIACRLTLSFAPAPWLIRPRPCVDIKQGSTPAFEAILGRIGSPHDNTQPSIRDLLRSLGQEISTVGPAFVLAIHDIVPKPVIGCHPPPLASALSILRPSLDPAASRNYAAKLPRPA